MHLQHEQAAPKLKNWWGNTGMRNISSHTELMNLWIKLINPTETRQREVSLHICYLQYYHCPIRSIHKLPSSFDYDNNDDVVIRWFDKKQLCSETVESLCRVNKALRHCAGLWCKSKSPEGVCVTSANAAVLIWAVYWDPCWLIPCDEGSDRAECWCPPHPPSTDKLQFPDSWQRNSHPNTLSAAAGRNTFGFFFFF